MEKSPEEEKKMKEPELDFESEEFDALAALTRTDHVQVPEPDAPIYDNLGQFISMMNRAKAKQLSTASSSSQDVILFVSCKSSHGPVTAGLTNCWSLSLAQSLSYVRFLLGIPLQGGLSTTRAAASSTTLGPIKRNFLPHQRNLIFLQFIFSFVIYQRPADVAVSISLFAFYLWVNSLKVVSDQIMPVEWREGDRLYIFWLFCFICFCCCWQVNCSLHCACSLFPPSISFLKKIFQNCIGCTRVCVCVCLFSVFCVYITTRQKWHKTFFFLSFILLLRKNSRSRKTPSFFSFFFLLPKM